MADINISVQQLICQDPVFTNVVYTGNRYEFDLSWTSQGDFLYSFDDTTTMYLKIDLYHPGQTTPYYSGSVGTPPALPFITTSYLINILDYDNLYSSKDRIVFTLTLTGEDSCYNEATYTIPEDSIT